MSAPSPNQLYERLGISPAQLQQFCEQAPITEIAPFGSILRPDFRSSIDILIRLNPNHILSLLDFIDLENQLNDLLKRGIDLLDRETVETGTNWIRRQEILTHAQVIYGLQQILSA